MWAVRFCGMVMAASLLSGCAGARQRQDMARLQSQVGLLDERLSQLERSGTTGLSSTSSSGSGASWDAGFSETSPSTEKKRHSVSNQASSSKPSTRDIQQALKNAGFYQGNVDGKAGPLTREATKEFQRVHGLVDDGVAGRQTWAKLRTFLDLSAGSGEATSTTALK